MFRSLWKVDVTPIKSKSFSLYTSPKLGVDSEVSTDLSLKARPEPGMGPTFMRPPRLSPSAPASCACHYLFFFFWSLASLSVSHAPALSWHHLHVKKAEWVNGAQWLSRLSTNNNNNSKFILCCNRCFIVITKKIKSNNKTVSVTVINGPGVKLIKSIT